MSRYVTECDHEGCTETVPGHKFGHIKAQDAGWFFQKNGKKWCPKHTPAWVEEWRSRQKQQEETTK